MMFSHKKILSNKKIVLLLIGICTNIAVSQETVRGVKATAYTVGNTVGDVTRKVATKIKQAGQKIKQKTRKGMQKFKEMYQHELELERRKQQYEQMLKDREEEEKQQMNSDSGSSMSRVVTRPHPMRTIEIPANKLPSFSR